MERLWDKDEEYKFFRRTLEVASPEQLFYITEDGRYLAYWPKNYKGKKATLQSRNAFIGDYTERWVEERLQIIADELNAYAVRSVVCEEIGLGRRSPADVAIVRNNTRFQKPDDIILIAEVKMSIVWNWEYDPVTGNLRCVGDYTTHQGNPGLLRSDTMLKAIGKGINIRVAGFKSSRIPIVIIGNTPITGTYHRKVDYLKQAGIIQGFYSLNPSPSDGNNGSNIKGTPQGGFMRIDEFGELKEEIIGIVREEREFFSGMISRVRLGQIIEIASSETSYERKAERFLEMLRGVNNG